MRGFHPLSSPPGAPYHPWQDDCMVRGISEQLRCGISCWDIFYLKNKSHLLYFLFWMQLHKNYLQTGKEHLASLIPLWNQELFYMKTITEPGKSPPSANTNWDVPTLSARYSEEDLRIYSKAQTARKSSEHPLKCPILIQLQLEWETKVIKATHGVHIYKI